MVLATITESGGAVEVKRRVRMLPVAALEECDRVRVRAEINERIVQDYAEAMESGAVFREPVIAYCEPGCERYVLADGWHRKRAAQLAGIGKLEVEVRDGTLADAITFAVSCNTKHGLRRSRRDLETAFRCFMHYGALANEHRTQRELADLFQCSERTIQGLAAAWRDTPESKAERQARQERAKAVTLRLKLSQPTAFDRVANDTRAEPSSTARSSAVSLTPAAEAFCRAVETIARSTEDVQREARGALPSDVLNDAYLTLWAIRDGLVS